LFPALGTAEQQAVGVHPGGGGPGGVEGVLGVDEQAGSAGALRGGEDAQGLGWHRSVPPDPRPSAPATWAGVASSSPVTRRLSRCPWLRDRPSLVLLDGPVRRRCANRGRVGDREALTGLLTWRAASALVAVSTACRSPGPAV
jgi:hypothetical protein